MYSQNKYDCIFFVSAKLNGVVTSDGFDLLSHVRPKKISPNGFKKVETSFSIRGNIIKGCLGMIPARISGK